MAASQTLRAALCKVEASHPGFSYDLVLGLVRKGDVAVNMNESLLRLQGNISEQDSKFNIQEILSFAIFCYIVETMLKYDLDSFLICLPLIMDYGMLYKCAKTAQDM